MSLMSLPELQLSGLILEDNPEDVELLIRQLRKGGITLTARKVETKADLISGLEEKPDIILADYEVAAFGAREALVLLQQMELSIPVIVVTGTLADEAGAECMALGAKDYLGKDRLDRLAPAVVRVHLERKLREEKEKAIKNFGRMAAVAEATPDFVGIADLSGELVYVNRAGREMTGLPRTGELFQQKIWDFFPDWAYPGFPEAAGPEEDDIWSGESLLRGPNGVEYPVSQVIIAHRRREGSYFSTVARDISDRIKAEAELRDSQARLEAVWCHSTEAMRLTNRDGIIQAVNEAYCRIVEMKVEDLVGKCFTVVYPEEDRQPFKALHRLRFDEGVPIQQEERRVRFLHRDREIDVEMSMSRIEVKGGEDLLLSMVRDVSEKKRLETQFLRSQRMECIGALAGGVAHDFNNILSPIFMASSILRMDVPPGDREKAISMIEASGERGAGMVRRLLSFARGIEGERKAVRSVEMLREVKEIMERSFPRSIKLQGEIQPDLWTVNGDRTQLHQVFLNLCLNARDAMPEGGVLLVEARNQILNAENLPSNPHARTGSYVMVSISDNGTGIAEENLEQIFEPFFSTKAEGRGTGLGLPTCLGIIHSHGGFITVKSKEGEGTRFDVYLPTTSRSVEKDVSPVKERNGDTAGGGGELILVVDDEMLVLDVMNKLLTRCGYRVLLAEDAAEALEHLLENGGEIGVIVTDIIMPDMNGLELLRRVKEIHPGLPAVAMSGNIDQEFLEKLEEIGVTEVIDKPFRADQLLKSLHMVLH